MEETAYLLDLITETKQPIVITGAMRSSNEIGSDGLYNFISALRVAAADEAIDKGVMVVLTMKYIRLETSPRLIPQIQILSKVLIMAH